MCPEVPRKFMPFNLFLLQQLTIKEVNMKFVLVMSLFISNVTFAHETCKSVAIKNAESVASIAFEPKQLNKIATKVISEKKDGVFEIELKEKSEEPLSCIYRVKTYLNVVGDCWATEITQLECSQ